jgi:hypothetical protein
MPVAGLIGLWWVYFLIFVPQAIEKISQINDSKIEH